MVFKRLQDRRPFAFLWRTVGSAFYFIFAVSLIQYNLVTISRNLLQLQWGEISRAKLCFKCIMIIFFSMVIILSFRLQYLRFRLSGKFRSLLLAIFYK